MKSRVSFSAAMTVVAGCFALFGKAETETASTVEIVDSVEISADTNVVVEAGRTLKFEYVYGENSVTLTKSGAGRLEIATSSHTNLSVNIAEGTFASARPAPIPLTDEFKPVLRVDASVTNTFTFAKANGTNFISKIVDADGNNERWLHAQYNHNDPYLADEKLNGMHLIDFGTYYDENDPRFAGGHGGCFWVNKIGVKDGFPVREYFYVWKDRDEIFDEPLIEGVKFRGPSVLGNNVNWFVRGFGGGGKGFELMADSTHSTYKNNFVIDGQKVSRSYCPSRGFHLLRNRADESKTDAVNWTMLGWDIPTGGGFILAEIVAYSNQLSETTALRIEAQLQAKWLGMKINTVTVQHAATLDVDTFKFNIKSLDLVGDVNIVGQTNLCFDALTRSSSNVVVSGVMEINGEKQPLVPDVKFEGEAKLDVFGTSRIQTVSSSADKLMKFGAGELLLANPEMSDITVSEGTLNVSALYVRSAEYHLDSTQMDTVEWTEEEGKKLVSKWHDMEDPARAYVKCESWLPVRFDETHILRRPYITENVVGNKPMIDFGTYFSAHHRDGWGGCLNGSPRPSGLVDMFVAWKDYPEVRNEILTDSANFITGPCFFGMEYHWARGRGGDGNGFPVHYWEVPHSMIYPANTGIVLLDGCDVDGRSYIVGDGVHVLAQRISAATPGGFSIQTLGGCDQAKVFANDTDNSLRGVFGGLMIGEVLMFKKHLSDLLRMRISGALCSKWRGDMNEWAYGSLKIASGATLKHPYADLVPDTLELAGKISAVSVKPKVLEIVGNEAEIDGTLKLSDGGCINISGDPENGFESLRATSVHASGKGGITMTMANPSAYVGEEYKIIDSANVIAEPNFQWRASALHGTGTRVSLKAKSDGVYLSFEGCGMTVTIR